MTSEGLPAATVTIDGEPFPIRPHHCFACGSTNAHGIGLALHVEGDSCWTEVSLPDRFEGWEGIAHGGVVCTILDEVMAWSLAHRDAWGVTARMSVDFRRPVPIGAPLRAEGRLVRARRRLLDTRARLVDATTGEVLASAEALYVTAPAAEKAALKERYGFGDAASPAIPDAADQGGADAVDQGGADAAHQAIPDAADQGGADAADQAIPDAVERAGEPARTRA